MRSNDDQGPPEGAQPVGGRARRRLEQELTSRFGAAESDDFPDGETLDAGPPAAHEPAAAVDSPDNPDQ